MEFDRDYCDEREKDMETITLENGLELEIPEEMIRERMDLLYMDREEAVEDVRHLSERYSRHLLNTGVSLEKYPEEIAKYLNAEIDTYRK